MAICSKRIEGLENGVTVYAKVFTVNPEGRVNNRADLPAVSAIPSEFPEEPTSYALIGTYTSSQIFTAPETGYYKIEVHGASGNGGNGGGYRFKSDTSIVCFAAGGGGGGGSGYGCSIVKLNKGDTIIIVIGTVGNDTMAQINSSIETYSSIDVSSGGNGNNGDPYGRKGGSGGLGGVSNGGNVQNLTGTAGTTGAFNDGSNTAQVFQVSGGSPAHSEGNKGGNGGSAYANKSGTETNGAGEAGKAGFVKIHRGNTNIVA